MSCGPHGGRPLSAREGGRRREAGMARFLALLPDLSSLLLFSVIIIYLFVCLFVYFFDVEVIEHKGDGDVG